VAGPGGSGEASPTAPARIGRPWNVLLPVLFAIGSADFGIAVLVDSRSVGSHALIYTDAARAWLSGGNPWTVGPPSAVFAGPPTMLLPFVPFVPLPGDLTRLIWVGGSAILAVYVLRRLRLPGWWIGFPPIFHAILLGHPEVLVLWLLVIGGLPSGLGPVIKPYGGLPLVAERRWTAIALGLLIVAATAPFLPWPQFISELSSIAETVRTQTNGDSTFGAPVLMGIAVVALGLLGFRRALWLATPLLWPGAQPIYKVISVPAMTPVIAVFWALPVPIAAAIHATLIGVVVEAALLQYGARRPLPRWISDGLHAAPWRDGAVLDVEQEPAGASVRQAPEPT
jgi:hypothetical protein